MRIIGLVAMLVVATPALAAPGIDETLLGATVVDSYMKPKGAFLNVVKPDSAVATAGLMPADVITGIDGHGVPDAGALLGDLARHRAGDTVQVQFVRQGEPLRQVAIVLGASAKPGNGDTPGWQRNVSASPATPPSPREESAGEWVTFTDPVEQAFSIDVPAGWRVEGGVRRMSQVEVRLGVKAVSPDGKIELFFGDANIPIFTVPNQMMAMAGLREGSTYSPGFGQQMVVQHYQAGDAFAAEWGMQRVGASCAGVRRMAVRPLPEASHDMDMAYASGGVRSSIRAGEASFDCSLGGGPAKAYVFAATELAQMPGSAVWQVKNLSGYIASADREGAAVQVLAHATASFRIDPGWQARYNQGSAQMSQAVAASGKVMAQSIADRYQAQQAASQSIVDRYNNASAAQDRNAQGFDEAVRGVHTYTDPDNAGSSYQLDNRYEHQWIVPGQTQPVGTDSSNPPVPGARELDLAPAH